MEEGARGSMLLWPTRFLQDLDRGPSYRNPACAVFDEELALVEQRARQMAAAGVDAVIVQVCSGGACGSPACLHMCLRLQ